MKYEAQIEALAHYTVEIEADSMEEAKQKVREVVFPKEEMDIEEAVPTFIKCEETGETDWW
jgi:hypothetical protein